LIKDGEQNWNKWRSARCNRIRGTISWVVLQFSNTIYFSAIGFKSAMDEPFCDPTSVEVYTLSPAETWSYVDAFILEFDPKERL
jgi:hypothetical protein